LFVGRLTSENPELPMLNVAVVTPYYREPIDVLRQCHDSVAKQSYPCLHVMVSDGHPVPQISGWPVDHITLPKSHCDLGATARMAGSAHAIGLGVGAIAYLDADNWYRFDHIEILVRLLSESGAAFLSSNRVLCRPDGSVMRNYATDPEAFVDTNCMMFARPAFPVLAQWMLMPRYAHLIHDRMLLYHVKIGNIRRAHSDEYSVFYRCTKEGIYRALGEPVPPGVQPAPDYASAHSRWVADGYPPLPL
jgi:hypothetical protein